MQRLWIVLSVVPVLSFGACGGDEGAQDGATRSTTAVSPTLQNARLDGSWKISLEVASQKASANDPSKSQTWTFDPTCATGACDVTMGGSLAYVRGGDHEVYVPLGKAAAVYRGAQPSAPLGCRARGSSDGTLSIRLRVNSVATAGGQPTAASIQGSGRCASSQANEYRFTFNGIRV
jgi:hypothetical protein